MSLFKKTLILVAFVIPLLTACSGSDGTDAPTEARYDSATFNKSTWK